MYIFHDGEGIREGDHLLFEAAKAGNATGVKHAFEKGANPNATDKTGRMAIHYAEERGARDIMKMLIENGADIGKAAAITRELAAKKAADARKNDDDPDFDIKPPEPDYVLM